MRRANFVGTKFGGGGKRGRAKIPSPQPPSFLPARAFQFCARSAQSFGVLLKKCSNFVQKTPPLICTQISTGFESRSEVAKSQSDRQRARRGRGNFCGAKIICDQIPPPPLKWALKSRHGNHVSAVFF